MTNSPLPGLIRAVVLAALAGLAAQALSAATFTVDSTGDESDADLTDGICQTALGTCTLRAAIEQANALAGADMIAFNILGSGVHTISPGSPLPALTDDAGVTIDGYTQPGSSPNTLAVGDNAVLLIEIDGTNAGTNANGLQIQGLSATVRGLVINRFAFSGILVSAGFAHQIGGCFLGTDPSGSLALGNRIGLWVDTTSGSPSPAVRSAIPALVTVGGVGLSDRNVLSGNLSDGIDLFVVTNCQIENNYVGTDSSGMLAIPNEGTGVALTAASVTLGPGDLFASPGLFNRTNVISGNRNGIICSFGGTNNISGNLVGTDATGTRPLPNGTGIQIVEGSSDVIAGNLVSGNLFFGIRTFASTRSAISNNRVGTDISGTVPLGNALDGVTMGGNSIASSVYSNVIAFNIGAGLSIGFDPTDASNDNRISSNSIHDNGGLGIDLGSDGVTPNNTCDSGRGPNLGQNTPVLTSCAPIGTSTRIRGTLNSVPNSAFSLEFFSNTSCDPSGYGEGQTFLGSALVTTGLSCDASFEFVLPVSVPLGAFITATATDPAGNTSEFSACRPVTTGEDFYSITPCRVADTRGASGAYGAPSLTPASDRSFVIAGQCGIPADAKAVAFNFAVTNPSSAGDIQVFPGGASLPVPATIFYSAGQTRANNGVFALGASGDIGTHVDQTSGTVDLIIDVTGYFR